MRIWTGRAGSGKTTAILREIAALSEKGEGRQILLVPELNSHLMERRLAAATHNHGARTAEVLTFSRLADRVFSEVGGLAQQMLTPAGQLLTLQEAARRVQGGLSAWKGLADKPELLQEALRLIDECKTCAVAPETLFAAAEESEDAVLAEKLSDLAQILTAYERLCEESLPDPRDRLTHLRDHLVTSCCSGLACCPAASSSFSKRIALTFAWNLAFGPPSPKCSSVMRKFFALRRRLALYSS